MGQLKNGHLKSVHLTNWTYSNFIKDYKEQKLVLNTCNDSNLVITPLGEQMSFTDYFMQSRQELIDCYGLEGFKAMEQINEAYKKRVYRLRQTIYGIVTDNEQPVFLTLTFRDDVLATTSEQTRRRYVTRFLKKHCKQYIANIDYGTENGREHYHAVISNKVDLTAWEYGAINGEKIVKTRDSIRALPKYISKLTNHAIKDTTKSTRIIYSRD